MVPLSQLPRFASLAACLHHPDIATLGTVFCNRRNGWVDPPDKISLQFSS